MSDAVHTEILRGYKIEILHDDDPQNPRKDYDHVAKMLCAHGRYNLGDEQFKSAESLTASVYDRHFPDAEVDDYTQDMLNECPIFWLPLYLYDHSGITMSTAPFSCRWDSGQVGIIYVDEAKAHEEWPKHEGETAEAYQARIEGYLRGEVEEYDHYLTGRVYGFRVSKPAGDFDGEDWEEIDSCWGFYGDYEQDDGCLDAARECVPEEEWSDPEPPNVLLMVFHEDGTVEFTRSPKLYNFFDGAGDMERISEIHKNTMGYYIQWLKGKWAGVIHTRLLARNYFSPDLMEHVAAPKFYPEHMRADETMYFDTYEAAVVHEVHMLAAMRRAGETFVDKSST